ncbi:histidine triad nucleotide-binding protein 3-like [Toxotes jaculatrix]|uniref:histidine triad nucleotide-binding protein 3-like n=1 Tax=Toxotes jaculatrix TaxID=941984 RepID=UPI001B3B1018|nr:histidine triad nucleotide-binding protein 3-like [Toxotes jaculatrix]
MGQCFYTRGNMASDKTDSCEETVETCIFCLIASGRDTDAKVLTKNKELVCFRDIDPAAPHHYLVVPRQHIHSCLSLQKEHIGLVKRMAEMGKAVLHEQGITDVKDIRLGFHRPPYISVAHLHLHVLAPTSQISEHMIYKFIPRTSSFISEKQLRKYLKDKPPRIRKHFES